MWMTHVALVTGAMHSFPDYLNAIKLTIKFTSEVEQDGRLSFLDTATVCHSDGAITTTDFLKSTHTDRYLDFWSHHSLAHKVAVTCILFLEAEHLCSAP